MPDFLVIGAGKSGTTSLDQYLKQHSEIFMSPVKEPNFFAYETKNVEDVGNNPGDVSHFLNSVTKLEEYHKLFKDAENGQLKGEISNTYLYGDDAPYRIKHHIPQVKMIAVLRNPTDRLYSRFLHLVRDGDMDKDEFPNCLDKSTMWWDRNDLIKEGYYYKHLSRFYSIFNDDQIKVFLFEDLSKNIEMVLSEIFTFLGVDPNVPLNVGLKYNESGVIRNKILNSLIGGDSLFKKVITLGSPKLFESIKENETVKKIIFSLRSKNLEKPAIDPKIRHELNNIYRDDILKLQNLINRDLTSWLNP